MKKMIISVCLIIAIFYLSSTVYGSKPAQDVESEISFAIALDEVLMEEENDRSAAWLGYLFARVGWLKENVDLDNFDIDSYQISFEEEAYAREAMADIWSELKMDNPGEKDRYLDELNLINENGFIREYVWVYLQKTYWETIPENLQLEEFLKWSSESLPIHKLETLGDIYLERE